MASSPALNRARALVWLGWASPAAGQPAAGEQEGEAEQPADVATEGDARPAGKPADPKTEPIDVVVTGKRKGEDPFTADRALSVVGSKQLRENQPRTTPEALWDTPGVFVQQTNHGGGSPIVHGLIGPQVLLLLDGVRINNSTYRTGPLQYLNLVDPLSLARVEVLRGPGSVLYGSDAMGGVIQLFPHEPRDARMMSSPELHVTQGMRYASAGRAVGAHGRAELGVEGLGVMAHGSLQSLGDLRGGGSLGPQPYSGYDDYTGLVTLDYRFGKGDLDGWRNKATYLVSRIDGAGRTDKLYDKQSLQIYDNETHLVYDRSRFEIDAIETVVELTPSYQHFFERKDAIRMVEDLTTRLGAVRDEVIVNTFGLDGALETTFIEDRLALRYGGLFYRDWVDARRLEHDTDQPWMVRRDQAYPSGSTYDHYGLFALLEGAVLASKAGHQINLRSGYRLHGMAGAAHAQAELPAVELSHLGHVFMGALQYLYEDRATLAFAFAQGFRAPNLQEAVHLGDTGKFFHVPNDELGPEKTDTVELLGRLRLWKLTVSWAGYVSMLDDLILRVPTTYEGQDEIDGKAVMHNVNAEGGLIMGTEGGLGLDLGHGFSAHGQMSYAWGEQYESEGNTEPLSRIPPLFGTTSLRYDSELPDGWHGFLETYWRWAFAQDRLSPEDETDARIPEGGTPGWWTWNLRAGLSDGEHHRLSLAVENLLDEQYKYHGSGIYAPGTNALLGYEVSY